MNRNDNWFDVSIYSSLDHFSVFLGHCFLVTRVYRLVLGNCLSVLFVFVFYSLHYIRMNVSKTLQLRDILSKWNWV